MIASTGNSKPVFEGTLYRMTGIVEASATQITARNEKTSLETVNFKYTRDQINRLNYLLLITNSKF